MSDYIILTLVTMVFAIMTLAGFTVWWWIETVPECFGATWPAKGHDCDKCLVKEDCRDEI